MLWKQIKYIFYLSISFRTNKFTDCHTRNGKLLPQMGAAAAIENYTWKQRNNY